MVKRYEKEEFHNINDFIEIVEVKKTTHFFFFHLQLKKLSFQNETYHFILN